MLVYLYCTSFLEVVIFFGLKKLWNVWLEICESLRTQVAIYCHASMTLSN